MAAAGLVNWQPDFYRARLEGRLFRLDGLGVQDCWTRISLSSSTAQFSA